MDYNREKHIELLKLFQAFKKEGKHMFRENRSDYLELLEYNSAIEEQIFWNKREEIRSVLNYFLSGEIDGETLCSYVFTLRHELITTSETFQSELVSGSESVKNFSFDKKAKKLNGFLTGLSCQCENFEDDYESEQFYNSIKNGLFNFQEAIR